MAISRYRAELHDGGNRLSKVLFFDFRLLSCFFFLLFFVYGSLIFNVPRKRSGSSLEKLEIKIRTDAPFDRVDLTSPNHLEHKREKKKKKLLSKTWTSHMRGFNGTEEIN